MSDHEFCRTWLRERRDAAKAAGVTIPKLYQWNTKIGTNRQFEVRAEGGAIIWQGRACCASHAKAEAIAALIDKAQEAKALPADPDGKNAERAQSGDWALISFQMSTGTDRESALADLLCNLMHLCDRDEFDFNAELIRAQANYKAETAQ